MSETKNILHKQGGIQLSSDKKYLIHENGVPFFWLADTWWYGATNRTPMDVFKQLIKDRKEKGFTVIQLVVGIPPETDPFSSDASNSGGLSFNKDWSINKKYFDEIDEKIKLLIDNGIVPCIVGGWGHQMDYIGVEPFKRLWDEIISRYSKLPVIFCLCGEANLILPPVPAFFQTETRRKKLIEFLKKYKLFATAGKLKNELVHLYFKRKDAALLQQRIKKWNEVAEYITQQCKGIPLLTAHVGTNVTAADLFEKPQWLAINSIQSGHSKDSVPFMVQSIRDSKRANIPMINMEPWYEGIAGDFDDYYQRFAFWACILSGAKGHTYGAHGIWQMSQKGENFMKHWGNSNWEKSLQFKGAEQLGKTVAFLRQYEWWKLEPASEITTPSWEKTQPFLPITAKIKNQYILIYIPDIHLIHSKLTITESFNNTEAILVNPETLQQKKISIKDKILHLPKQTTKDAVVIVQVSKSEA